jgi:hypothetical protein
MKKNNPNIDKVGFSFLLLDQLDSGSGFGFKGINLNVDVKNPGLLNQQIKIQ